MQNSAVASIPHVQHSALRPISGLVGRAAQPTMSCEEMD